MSNIKTMTTAARAVSKRPFRVSIEGNIGSGKSTCINFFNKYKNVEKHVEPLNEWRNVDGHNLLGLMYSDINKWIFAFQHYVLLTRLKIQTSPPSHPGISVKMFERSNECSAQAETTARELFSKEGRSLENILPHQPRSVQNSRHCFVENARKQKCLHESEYEVLTRWFEYTEKHLDINLDLIVYLKTSPQVVWERMMKRGRTEESEVPLDYLQQIHEAYEAWLNSPEVGCEVLTIDADRGLDQVKEDLERYSYKILGGNHTN